MYTLSFDLPLQITMLISLLGCRERHGSRSPLLLHSQASRGLSGPRGSVTSTFIGRSRLCRPRMPSTRNELSKNARRERILLPTPLRRARRHLRCGGRRLWRGLDWRSWSKERRQERKGRATSCNLPSEPSHLTFHRASARNRRLESRAVNMNWTGGRLQRSKNANNGVVQKQKAHFARARTRLQNGATSLTSPSRPSFVHNGDTSLGGRLPPFPPDIVRRLADLGRPQAQHERAGSSSIRSDYRAERHRPLYASRAHGGSQDGEVVSIPGGESWSPSHRPVCTL